MQTKAYNYTDFRLFYAPTSTKRRAELGCERGKTEVLFLQEAALLLYIANETRSLVKVLLEKTAFF